MKRQKTTYKYHILRRQWIHFLHISILQLIKKRYTSHKIQIKGVDKDFISKIYKWVKNIFDLEFYFKLVKCKL